MFNKKEVKKWDNLWQLFAKDIFFKPNLKVTNEIIELFDGTIRGIRILEIGSGSGSDCISLAKQGGRCFALDFSEEALRVCRQLAYRGGVNVETIVADCHQIPADNASFDLVFSVGLIEHFPDPFPILREQLRVLKLGGYLIIDVPQKYNLYTFVKHLKIMLGRNPFGWETQYSQGDLKKIGQVFKIKPIRFYGRDSAFAGRLPRMIDHWWRELFAKIEESKLAPLVCLNIGAIYQKEGDV